MSEATPPFKSLSGISHNNGLPGGTERLEREATPRRIPPQAVVKWGGWDVRVDKCAPARFGLEGDVYHCTLLTAGRPNGRTVVRAAVLEAENPEALQEVPRG